MPALIQTELPPSAAERASLPPSQNSVTAIFGSELAHLAGAIALYSGLRFVVEGRRPGYYQAPLDDAVLMRLKLA